MTVPPQVPGVPMVPEVPVVWFLWFLLVPGFGFGSNAMKTVDYRWPPEQLRAFCESEPDWYLEIPKSVPGEELAELYPRHVASPARYNPIISEIAEHSNTPVHILNEILARFSGDETIASALATNPSAPRSVLEALTKSAFESVREHAELNLRRSRA